MNDLSWLARQINVAADDKDKAALQVWTQKCRDMLDGATDVERVFLRYYEAYALAGIGVVKSTQSSYASEWDQPEAIAEILALRQAINEPAFDEAPDALRHRVQTNLGICLNKLGRQIAAIEQWDRVLRHNQKFAMALGHRARGISRYAGSLYDLNHALVLFNAARSDYDKALSETAEWDEDEHSLASPTFRDGRDEIDHYLKKFDFDDNYDLNQWSIGDSENERHYRRWCLHKRLFLTPLNDVTTLSCAASDVLHLPDHRYKVGEVPRFVGLYNLLKQEYVGSRYHLYCAM